MINKDKTLTVGDLLKMLADGRVTVDMPIAVFHRSPDCMVGVVAVEIVTYDDGGKALTVYTGEPCASLNDIASSAEVYC
jgi:hypothetical protein